MNRVLLVAAVLAATTAAAAAPVLVEFVGEITHIGSEAPENFFIGEPVAGGFVYDPFVDEMLAITTQFTSVDTAANPPNGWPAGYQGFPSDDNTALLTQFFPSGALSVSTASGFTAIDPFSEINWVGLRAPVYTVDDSSTDLLTVFNRGLYSNGFLPLASASTLTTLSGPIATGISLKLDNASVDPSLADEEGFYPLHVLMPAEPFPGIVGGTVAFGAIESPSFGTRSTSSIDFEVTDFRVTPVPEPMSWCVLLLAIGSSTCAGIRCTQPNR